jgi:hypothetical protein
LKQQGKAPFVKAIRGIKKDRIQFWQWNSVLESADSMLQASAAVVCELLDEINVLLGTENLSNG